jgi:formylglycine-generating enzyme required for sulfatase activity
MLHTMSESSVQYDVFLSYSSADRSEVRRLAAELEARGCHCFLDEWYLTPGRDWVAALETALSRSRSMAIFLGAGELGRWQQREKAWGLDRMAFLQERFPVILVLLPKAVPPVGLLRQLTWVDLRGSEAEGGRLSSFDESERLNRLAQAILGQSEASPQGQRALHSPFRGLNYFREEDADLFCGREAYSERLWTLVQRQRLIAVTGASGCGKSSLVRAGLVPRLRRPRPEGDVWEILTVVPTKDPLRALAEAFQPLLEPGTDNPEDREVQISKRVNRLKSGELRLHNLIRVALEKQPGTSRLLLFVDQWEELYTLCESAADRHSVIRQILDEVRNPATTLTVIFTIRWDFYSHVLNDRPLLDAVADSRLELGPMNRDEFRQVIETPAARCGLQFERRLVELILKDAEKAPGCLPLLEFLLDRLWQLSLRESTVSNASYTSLGELEGSLASYADERFRGLTTAEQAACAALFRRLVHAGETVDKDTRRRAELESLSPGEVSVAKKLIEARLLVVGGASMVAGQDGGQTVEVAHEELLRCWQALKDCVEQHRRFLRWRRELDAQIEEFQKSGSLLSGRRLREARQFYPSRRSELELRETDLLRRSFARRLQWWLIGVSLLCLLCLLCLGVEYSRAMNKVQTLLATPPDRVQEKLDELAPYRWLARWRLAHEMTDGKTDQDRLHATLAMARFFPDRTVLHSVQRLWQVYDGENDWRKLAVQQLYVGLGPISFCHGALDVAEGGDTTLVTEFLVQAAAEASPARVASELAEILRQEQDPQQQAYLQYLRCLLLGACFAGDAAVTDEILSELSSLYQTASDAGVHAAARWALRQHGKTLAELDADTATSTEAKPIPEKNWYVTAPVTSEQGEASGAAAAPGLTLIRIPSVPGFVLGAVAGAGKDKDPGDEDPTTWVEADRKRVSEFWMSDREVSREQFQTVCPEWLQETSEIAATDRRHPAREVNWYDALLFCNRLSAKHGLPQYYEFDEGQYDWAAGELKDGAKFPSIPNPAGGSYRLPTEREWEYACRALSAVDYSFGSSTDALDLFARWNNKAEPLACGSLRPNRWGLSDMHGNVYEWCWDRYDATDKEAAGTGRVLRGGAFDFSYPDLLRCAFRNYFSPDNRNLYFGFRISRTK